MKPADIKQLSISDLREKIREEQGALEKMTFSHSISPVENPLKIRATRRTIARMITILRQREKEENSKK